MTKLSQKGFTLVELAIVLTIIGLLIGGILKGQQLMTNARITATIAQINAVDAAVTTFRDTYGGFPGDLARADLRVRGWTNQATPPGAPLLGDGTVGQVAWNMAASQGTTNVAFPSTSVDNETLMYWGQLGQAGLLSGINWNGAAVAAGAATYGVHAPVTRSGGGFIVGNANGAVSPPTTAAIPTRQLQTGQVLTAAPSPVQALVSTTGTQLFTPGQAAQIDRKLDDGNPIAGNVQMYGFTSATALTGCVNTTVPITYNEAQVNARDCGLIFEIQG